jgi:glutathione synthase/RimK-type ligase-like ATP-grasp enzyme
MRIAIVTSKVNPLADGEMLLPSALEKAGYSIDIESWDDQSVSWNQYNYAIIRTPWNYINNPEAFLRWLNRVSNETPVFNHPNLIKWNIDKSYLLDLEGKGIRIVPTSLVDDTVSFDLAKRIYGSDVVIKPLIGNSAVGITRKLPSDYKPNERYLVQPFVHEVANGVISVMFFGGELSHSIRSIPAANDFRTQPQYGTRDEKYILGEPETNYCKKVLSTLPILPLYARVDYILDDSGPMLLELELIEPYLFFEFSDDSTQIFTNALKRQISGIV